MSLTVDGFWKVGFWDAGFWANGFWLEGGGAATAVPTVDARKRQRVGPHTFGYDRFSETDRERAERLEAERRAGESEESSRAARPDRAGDPLTPAEIYALAGTRQDREAVAALDARIAGIDADRRLEALRRARDEEIRILLLPAQTEQDIVFVIAALAAID